MSYDVSFEIDTGGPEPVIVGDDCLNYTYNCYPMFRQALGGDGINDLNGMFGGDAIARLEAAVIRIRNPANKVQFMAMTPKNGWGSHSGAACFLEAILDNARLHPKAKIRVS